MPARAARAKVETNEFAATFAQLRAILARHADKLKIVQDKPDYFYLDTVSPSYKGKPMGFAAVRIMKSYVSFHLLPLYWYPEMNKTVSKELALRRQGKACFNFKVPDKGLFKELQQLVDDGFERYRKNKLL